MRELFSLIGELDMGLNLTFEKISGSEILVSEFELEVFFLVGWLRLSGCKFELWYSPISFDKKFKINESYFIL